MIEELRLAFRNVCRNFRRSLVTVLAVGFSCAAVILIAGYFRMIFVGSELQVVTTEGHLQVHKPGYLDVGAGDPLQFAIDDYRQIESDLLADPAVAEKLVTSTARLVFQGLASNEVAGRNAPFYGFGVIPEDEERIVRYNPYLRRSAFDLEINESLIGGIEELDASEPKAITLGVGLALMLGFKPPITPDTLDGETISTAAARTAPATSSGSVTAAAPDFDMLESLVAENHIVKEKRPSVELLAIPPGGGVPNLGTYEIRKTQNRARKDLDERVLKMHLKEASELLFPGQPTRATAIILLLNDNADSEELQTYLKRKFKQSGRDLEVSTWQEINPFSMRLMNMFHLLYVFIASVLGVMVLFMIYNTMSMGIIERIPELGTLRAIGLTRRRLVTGLVLEGTLLGVSGAVLGCLLAVTVAFLVNEAQIIYLPPAVNYYVALEIMVQSDTVIFGSALGVLAAMLSSLLPAWRTAKLTIVDALHHV